MIGPLGYRPHEALAELRRRGGPARRRVHAACGWSSPTRSSPGCASVPSSPTPPSRALRDAAPPGVDERELGNLVERAYVGRGGTTHIHYFGATPMDAPARQRAGAVALGAAARAGDALTCEVSASFWDYTGQVLRTFAVGAEPPPLYRELHAVADAAFDAHRSRALRAGRHRRRPGRGRRRRSRTPASPPATTWCTASSAATSAGARQRAAAARADVPDFTFEAGMTVVVQPNVVTPDERAGVQTGELVLVSRQGAERLHRVERGDWFSSAGRELATVTRWTASTIPGYPVHRQRLPASASRISSLAAPAWSRTKGSSDIRKPAVQNPHCSACFSWNARCSG